MTNNQKFILAGCRPHLNADKSIEMQRSYWVTLLASREVKKELREKYRTILKNNIALIDCIIILSNLKSLKKYGKE